MTIKRQDPMRHSPWFLCSKSSTPFCEWTHMTLGPLKLEDCIATIKCLLPSVTNLD